MDEKSVQSETYNQVVFLTAEHMDIMKSMKVVIEKERIATGTFVLFNLLNTSLLVFVFLKTAEIIP